MRTGGRKSGAVILLAALISLGWSGSDPPGGEVHPASRSLPLQQRELRIGFVTVGNFLPLPPDLQPDGAHAWIMRQVYGPGLIGSGTTAGGEPVFQLVTSFAEETIRGSWTLKLREGIRFQDESDLDPQDVRETIDLYRRLARAGDPDVDPAFGLVDTVMVNPDGSITFTMDSRRRREQPYRVARVVPLPAETAGRIRGDLVTMREDLSQAFLEPVGLGGYTFEIGQPQPGPEGRYRVITLRSFDRYFQGRPAIREIAIHFYATERQLIQGVVTGEVDVAGMLTWQASAELQAQSTGRRNLHFRYFPRPDHFYYLAFNNDAPLLVQGEVRDAIRLAIDRDHLRLGVPREFSPIADVPIQPHPPDEGASGRPRRRPAMNLLTQLHFSRSGDLLTDPSGQRVRLRLHYPDHIAMYEGMARSIKNDLQRLGFLIEAIPVGPEELWGRLCSGEYDLALNEMTMPPTPDVFQHWFGAGAIAAGTNFVRYRSPNFNSNLNAVMRGTGSTPESYWQGALNKFAEDAPLVPLYFSTQQYWIIDGDVVELRSVGQMRLRLEPLARWRRK
jgi:ABC-type transport system substrate-binding protein